MPIYLFILRKIGNFHVRLWDEGWFAVHDGDGVAYLLQVGIAKSEQAERELQKAVQE